MNHEKNKGKLHWENADALHSSAKHWDSSLNFIKDEQQFFEDLLQEQTLPIIACRQLSLVQHLIDTLRESQKKYSALKKALERNQEEFKKLKNSSLIVSPGRCATRNVIGSCIEDDEPPREKTAGHL